MPRIELGPECPQCGANMNDPNEVEMGVCRPCELKGWFVDCMDHLTMADTWEDVGLPVDITCKVRALVNDGPAFIVVVVEHPEIVEFTVPRALVTGCGALPGDTVRCQWDGPDLDSQVVSLEVV